MPSETAAKAKGAAKATATALKGETGIFSTLAKEHGEVSSLLKQAVSAEGAKKKETVEKIRVEVLSHAKAEEATFYKALDAHAQTRELAAHSRKEHAEIETLLAQLKEMAPSAAGYQQSLLKLQESIEHHAKEEESAIFSEAHEVFSTDDKKRLDAEFKQEKQVLRERFAA